MRIFKLLALILVVGLLFSTNAIAESGNGKESLVSLGDSIPFGYNLSQSNASASRDAFPYLIGDDGNLRVRNLGVPGWTTDKMLAALETDQKYRQAVRHANYITLTIGNNDLLQILKAAQIASVGNPNLFTVHLQQIIEDSNVFENIGNIIEEVRSLSDAPIVVYNVYNPFQLNNTLHSVSSLVLPGINTHFKTLTNGYNALYGDVLLANAYTAFGQEQATYVIPKDIHPTNDGQLKLAEIGLEALGLSN